MQDQEEPENIQENHEDHDGDSESSDDMKKDSERVAGIGTK